MATDTPKPNPFGAQPTSTYEPPTAPTPAIDAPVAATDLMTEQEKDTSGEVPGVGPASPSVLTTGPAETIEDLGIGPREPYPTGGAPAVAAEGEPATFKKGPGT